MPKEVHEINSFNVGTITSTSERDAPENAASYSLNLDSLNDDGKLKGIPEDRLVASLSTNLSFESINYGLQWGASAIRVANLSIVPTPSLTGKGSRITFKGTAGKQEVLNYSSYYFDTSQIKDCHVNASHGIGDASNHLSATATEIFIDDLDTKRPGLLQEGYVITLKANTNVNTISSDAEWMLITNVNIPSSTITVERGHYGTTPKSILGLGSTTNVFRLDGLHGWINVSGWQTNFKNNHLGQNPCLITVADASSSSAYNLVHDSANKSITITSDSLNNNLGNADSLEDLIRNDDTVRIITSAGVVVTVVVDYMANGVINYSSISDSLSNVTSGSYWIDSNKLTNGNFKAYSTSPNVPLGWTTVRTGDNSSITYDDVYAADTNSIGSPQLSLTGGVTGIKGNERGTASDEVPFLILGNYRDTRSAVDSITLESPVGCEDNIIELSDISNISQGDVLVLSHGVGVTADNITGDAADVVDDSPYLDNYKTPGYKYGAINTASFTDHDMIEINVPSLYLIDESEADRMPEYGDGVSFKLHLVDGTNLGADPSGNTDYICISNQDADGANASDEQLALNIVGAINGTIDDVQQVVYSSAVTASFGNGVSGLQASINADTATKIDLQYPVYEEYVQVHAVDVSQDASGNNTAGSIAVYRRHFPSNKVSHKADASVKKIEGVKVSQTTTENSIQPGKNYRLTWWVSDVTRAWLQDNTLTQKSMLDYQIKIGNGYILGSTFNTDENIVGANGENTWRKSDNVITSEDSNTIFSGRRPFSGSCYVTLDGNKDITGALSNYFSQATIPNIQQIPDNERPFMGETISVIQDSGTTVNGNHTVGDDADENYTNSSGGAVYTNTNNLGTALIHMNAVATTNSKISIPKNEEQDVQYTAWASALAGESALNSNGSDPKRRFYIDFEDFVGVLREPIRPAGSYNGNDIIDANSPTLNYTGKIQFHISAADGHFAYILVNGNTPNPQNGLIDGRWQSVIYGQMSDEATRQYWTDNRIIMVPKDGANIGFFQTYPTAYPYDGSGGEWSSTGTVSGYAGAVLNTGTAWAKSLKLCIEMAFNNFHGDGVTRFTVTRSGSKLCIEDAIGGAIIPELSNTMADGTIYYPSDYQLKWLEPGKMNFTPVYNNQSMTSHYMHNGNGFNNTVHYTNILNSTENSGGPGHFAFFKKDGLGINLGGIIDASGNYDSDYGANTGIDNGTRLNDFTVCYHKGSNAGESATNLDLAIEHANGQNGTITGNVANTDELTLTQTVPLGELAIKSEEFFGFSSIAENFTLPFGGAPLISSFEFRNGQLSDYNGGAKTLLWQKCQVEFTVPEHLDVNKLTISFKSNGQVLGTRNVDAIGSSATLDKYSSLAGLCGVSLNEITDLYTYDEGSTDVSSSAIIKDSDNKEVLVYHDKHLQKFKAIQDFGDPLDGHENTTMPLHHDSILEKHPSFTKNNRELHIGLGPNERPLWAGFLNHKQFGTDYLNEFVFEDGVVSSYDNETTVTMDKIATAGEWHFPHSNCSYEANNITFAIDSTAHGMNLGDYVSVRAVIDHKHHLDLGAMTSTGATVSFDSNSKSASCYYCHPVSHNANTSLEGVQIIDMNESSFTVTLPNPCIYASSPSSRYAYRVRPSYHYGIARNQNFLYRINSRTGMTERASLPFATQSICTSYSQVQEQAANSGSKFLGGRVWIAESNTSEIHRVNVGVTSFNELSAEATVSPRWCTWWSATDGEGEVVQKDKPPTDRGYVSDIVETWGLKGGTDDLENDSDSRLWVQFYPHAGNTFGALDNFLYCADSDGIENQNIELNFCNRTIPLNHTNGHEFDPHNRLGINREEYKDINSSPGGDANDGSVLRANIISKRTLEFAGGPTGSTRNTWFNPNYFQHHWSPQSEAYHMEEMYASEGPETLWKTFDTTTGTADYDIATFFNYAENIGWDDSNPSFKMVRYGLIGLSDNDFDGVIDGTGLPVSSAANVNVGFTNGTDCSSHAAAVLMQTESSWIMQGSIFNGRFNGHQNYTFEDTFSRNQNYHMHPSFTEDSIDMPAELFKPGAFFMVSSDLWTREVADTSQSTMRNGYSQGATLQNQVSTTTNNENSLFFNSMGTIAQGKLHHWSSDISGGHDDTLLKDRMYVLKTNEKHHLTIGDSLIFARHSDNFRKSHIFGQGDLTATNQNEYGMPAPVVGIVDDYHFLVDVTIGGAGTDTARDTGGTVSGQLNQLSPHWKVGCAEYDVQRSGYADGRFPTSGGGRFSVREFKIEGGGLTFFSDMSNLTTSRRGHFSNGSSDTGSFHGTLSFNTSLLSFSHARMIRPLGDGDISGVNNFNINNNMSLSVVNLPNEVPGQAADPPVNFGNGHGTPAYDTDSPEFLLPCSTKLILSDKNDSNGTDIYTFDWANLMPDTTRATFTGVDYQTETGVDIPGVNIPSTHRNWGTYLIGNDTPTGSLRLCHPHSINTNDGHSDQPGCFKLSNPLATTQTNPSTEDLNFMVPGSIQLGQGGWNSTSDFDGNDTQGQKRAVIKPGNVEGLECDSNGSLSKASLLSNYWHNGGQKKSPFWRKGAFVDMVAIWSVVDEHLEISEIDHGYNNPYSEEINRPQANYNVGYSYARKIIASYSTTGISTSTKLRSGGTGAHSLTDTRTAQHSSEGNSNSRIDMKDSRVYLRTHYPLPGRPTSINDKKTVSLIKARDAALCPVRLDLSMTHHGVGYKSPGSEAYVRLEPVLDFTTGQQMTGQIISGNWTNYQGHNHTVDVYRTAASENANLDMNNNFEVGDTIFISNALNNNGNPNPVANGEWKIESVNSDGVFVTEPKENWDGNTFWNGVGVLHGAGTATKATIRTLNKGLKANPLTLDDISGLSLSSTLTPWPTVIQEQPELSNYLSTVSNVHNRSLVLNHLGVSKGGSYVSGRLHQKIGDSSFIDIIESYEQEPRHGLGQIQASSGWLNASSLNQVNGFLNNMNLDNDNVTSFLAKTEGSVIPIPASSPNQGNENFTQFGDYTYKISYVYDGYQEGPLSSSSFSINEIDSGQTYSDFDVTVKISSPSKRLTSICLYRKNNVNDLYRLVEEVPTDSTWSNDGEEYIRVIRDNGALGATFESRAGYSEVLTNPFAQYGIATSLNGYHFVADCSHPQIKDSSHMVFRSLPGQFDLFNWANDYFVLPSKPTAMANFAGRLYVFDDNNTYRINPQTLVIEDIFEGSGCVSSKSIKVTEFGMFYCDRNNAYWHKGSHPEVISQPIKVGGATDTFTVSDFSWVKTAGDKNAMAPELMFDNRRNSMLFFVEKPADSKVDFSRYYCWAFSLLGQRWDLWEVSTGHDGAGNFNSAKVIKPSSFITTVKGKTFMTQGDFIVDYLGGKELRQWEWMSKKITVSGQSQKKAWKNIKIIGSDDDVTLASAANPKGAIAISVDGNIIGDSDKTFTKDSPDGKVTIKGSSKNGKYIQLLITKMKSSIDGIGIVFRRKGIK